MSKRQQFDKSGRSLDTIHDVDKGNGRTEHLDRQGRRRGDSYEQSDGRTDHYDSQGKLIGRSYEQGDGRTDHYDSSGQLTGRTYSRGGGKSELFDPSGQKVRTIYDDRNVDREEQAGISFVADRSESLPEEDDDGQQRLEAQRADERARAREEEEAKERRDREARERAEELESERERERKARKEAAAAERVEEGEGKTEEGWEALNEGDAAGALKLFNEAIRLTPDYVEPRVGKVWALSDAGKNEAARNALDDLLGRMEEYEWSGPRAEDVLDVVHVIGGASMVQSVLERAMTRATIDSYSANSRLLPYAREKGYLPPSVGSPFDAANEAAIAALLGEWERMKVLRAAKDVDLRRRHASVSETRVKYEKAVASHRRWLPARRVGAFLKVLVWLAWSCFAMGIVFAPVGLVFGLAAQSAAVGWSVAVGGTAVSGLAVWWVEYLSPALLDVETPPEKPNMSMWEWEC